MIVLNISPTMHQTKRLLEELIDKLAKFRYSSTLGDNPQIEIFEIQGYSLDMKRPYGRSFMIDFKGFDGETHQVYIHFNDVTAFQVWEKL
jgi:hypothetical protein